MEITELTHDDPDFYPALGPYLARRAVYKQVGDTIWDDDGKTWLLAHTPATGELAGFCGVITRGKRTLVESLYTLDEDDTATAAALLTHAVQAFGHDRHLEAIVRHALVPAHTGAGFAVTQELKNFTKLVRPATVTKKGRHV